MSKSKTKHTPGPWMVRAEYSEDLGSIYSINTLADSSHLPYVQLDEVTGNERLIEAAPDMLEALESVLELHKRNIVIIPCSLFDTVNFAIAKAKGGAK